jgi:RHS repeat-associated protein
MLFISGIHGVGKSYFCEKVKSCLGINAYSASTLISELKSELFKKDKLIADIENNQGYLLAAVKKLDEMEQIYLLDGHLCLLNAQGDVQRIGIDGSLKDTIGALNPYRYRSYRYDTETGLYYLNSRYYDPEVGRFINADGYVATGQGILGTNMFSYCGNNPVNRADPTGMFWNEIGSFFKSVGSTIANFAAKIFGAGNTVVHQEKAELENSPIHSVVSVKTGTKKTTTLSKKGDSSKPISVYAKGRSDAPILSSAGLKVNVSSLTINASFGLEDLGISGSINNGDTSRSLGIVADLTQFKVGVEGSTTAKWDANADIAHFTNVSVSGWAIAAACVLVGTGLWAPTPQPAN